MSRIKKSAAVAAVGCSLVGGFEGLRQNAYPDPATHGKPWTICYGETQGVQKGDHRSIEECKQGLITGLDGYGDKVEACVHVPMSDRRFIALVSFAWNVGPGAACKSNVVRLINAGRGAEGCNALLKWNRAAGIVFPGLTRRRVAERQLCLENG